MRAIDGKFGIRIADEINNDNFSRDMAMISPVRQFRLMINDQVNSNDCFNISRCGVGGGDDDH